MIAIWLVANCEYQLDNFFDTSLGLLVVGSHRTYPTNLPNSLGFIVPDFKNSSTCQESQNHLANGAG
jgi:hypothetical protein